jgi:hypothetical protein
LIRSFAITVYGGKEVLEKEDFKNQTFLSSLIDGVVSLLVRFLSGKREMGERKGEKMPKPCRTRGPVSKKKENCFLVR